MSTDLHQVIVALWLPGVLPHSDVTALAARSDVGSPYVAVCDGVGVVENDRLPLRVGRDDFP